ncbi:MAG: hypothetical protein WCJ19_04350 [bacterium]
MKEISPETKLILQTINSYGPVRPTDLTKVLNISNTTLHKHLSKLLDEQLVVKLGKSPRVYYSINSSPTIEISSGDKDDKSIEESYIYVSPTGEIIRGLNGFKIWSERNGYDFLTKKKSYIQRLKEINKLKKSGYFSSKKTILSGRRELYLDNVFFSEYYNFDDFGKTKLGQLVYVSKTSQNKDLIREIARNIKPDITKIIKKFNIKIVCFIPPTIDRKIQFLDVLKQALNLEQKEIKICKIPSPTKVAQKTLRKLDDRIINAQTTIAVNPVQIINKNVLIIDDATGSGATMNETAKKIRKISKDNIKIYGYSVVGSYKGYDVISEV